MITSRLKDFIGDSDFGGWQIQSMGGAGSDRIFHRIQKGENSAVVMSRTGHGAHIEDWLEVQGYLHDLGFGVPNVYAHDVSIPAVIFEDFGEFHQPEENDYGLIVRELARLAVLGGRNIAECPVAANRPFDFQAFRWESEYFAEQYLLGFRKMDGELVNSLSSDFDLIAEKLSQLPKYFTHRDFQSTNVTVINGTVRIIDFQSAHFGPAEYDLASLLWDPYAQIPDDFHRNLISKYIDEFEKHGGFIDREEFASNLELAAVSRLMQALGAFCFLSSVKGKLMFTAHIPAAEMRLKKLLAGNGRFEKLKKAIFPME
ncbi:MAG TPA: hypothetical protein ENN75_03165 [candidate division Zixibacteria bacterium]|nr:hypothetical protein [candidate division Zixibacteria bacterium]